MPAGCLPHQWLLRRLDCPPAHCDPFLPMLRLAPTIVMFAPGCFWSRERAQALACSYGEMKNAVPERGIKKLAGLWWCKQCGGLGAMALVPTRREGVGRKKQEQSTPEPEHQSPVAVGDAGAFSTQ